MITTVSDATVVIFVVGRSSGCGQEAAELLSKEAGAIGGVQMRAIGGFATGVGFMAGRSSRYATFDRSQRQRACDGSSDLMHLRQT